MIRWPRPGGVDAALKAMNQDCAERARDLREAVHALMNTLDHRPPEHLVPEGTAWLGCSNAEQFHPEWLAALAESQGFLSSSPWQLYPFHARKSLELQPALEQGLQQAHCPVFIAGAFLIMAVVISVVMLVIGLLLLRSGWRWWQHLQEDLKRNRIAVVEGFVVGSGPTLVDYLVEDPNPRPGRVRAQDLDCYIVQGVRFQVEPHAWYAFEGP